MIDKRNFEENTSKMQILAIRAILRAPGPLPWGPPGPMKLEASKLVLN